MRLMTVRQFRDELRDLMLWPFGALIITLCWILFFHWRPADSISQYDGVVFELPLLKAVMQAHGDPSQLLYSSERLGGITPYPSLGISWVYRIVAKLGLPIQYFQNIAILLLQTAFSYLGIRFSESLTRLLRRAPVRTDWRDWLSKGFQVVIFAFAPALAWQLTYGHWVMVLGTLVFFSVATVLLSFMARRGTLVLSLCTAAIVYSNFQILHQQAFVYGFVFGFPIILGILFLDAADAAAKKRALAVCLCLLFGGAGVAAGDLFSLLNGLASGESARSLGGAPVVYQYMTATARDWFSSLTWGLDLIPNERPTQLRHEVGYVIGPILLVLAAFPWKSGKSLAIGLVASTLLVLGFSTDTHPISTGLLEIVPVLKKFRVPLRAALPLVFILPAIAAAAVQIRCDSDQGSGRSSGIMRYSLGQVILLGLTWALRGWGREILFLVLLGPLFYLITVSEQWRARLGVAWLWMGLLAAGSLLAFVERAPVPQSYAERLGKFTAATASIQHQAPALASPLVRANVQLGPSILENNLGAFMGVSTITGYYPPPDRFLRLVSALTHIEYEPSTINIGPELIQPALPVLSQLYNIRYDVLVANGKLSVTPGPRNTLGPAWFPGKLVRVTSYPELASLLLAADAKPEGIAGTAPIVAEERTDALNAPSVADPGCASAEIQSVEVERSGQLIKIGFHSPSVCPLVVSTNFSAALSATQLDAGGNPLDILTPVFPVYGALTGVMISPRSASLRIEAVSNRPWWILPCQFLGLLLVLSACFVLIL